MLAVIEMLYLLAANILLNAAFVPQKLSRNPDRFSVEWTSAWTIVPGHLHVAGLKASVQTAQQKWWLSIGEADARLALGSLFFKTFLLQGVEVDSLTAGLRDRLSLASAPAAGAASGAAERPTAAALADAPPPTPTPPASEESSDWSGWSIAVSDADIGRIQALDVNGYRFSGQAQLRLEDFNHRLDGPLALARGSVQVRSGQLQHGSDLLAADLQSAAEIRIDAFVPGENPGAAAARFVSGRIDVSGDLASFSFVNAYLSDNDWLQLDGRGRLQGKLQIENGSLLDGSELSFESPALTLVLDERLAAGTGERHLVQGAGRVHGDVGLEQGQRQTRLQVELRDVRMRRLPQDELFLQAQGFRLEVIAARLNLSEKPDEPAVSMQWQEAVMPNIALLNAYLPDRLPFRLVAGEARLNARFAYAARAASGSLALAGDKISGVIFDKSVSGTLAVDLILKEADLANRRLDLSGSRISMQASRQGAKGDAGAAALQTELKIVQAQLTSALSLDELRNHSGRPPLSGEVKLEGTVANIDFLNAFLPARQGIEFGGGGRLRADLRLHDGRLAAPSSLTVESKRLLGRFSGFEASGSGGVSAAIRPPAANTRTEELRVELALRDMQVRQQKGGAVFLRGKSLQLTATSPPLDLAAKRIEPSAVLTWNDALLPDVALLNSYFPGKPPFSLSSGSARSSGRLNYAGRKLSGTVNLAGEKIAGTLFTEAVVGQLGVDLVIKQADPASGFLDLSGSRLQMQAATAKATANDEAGPLQTRITLTEARLKSPPLARKSADSGRLSPVSGVVKLEGSVANIAFLNSFLPADQGLAFSGDAQMNAELRLAQGQLAPGSHLTAESEHLVSRFLDFEASGKGVLKAAIQGDAAAPEGKVEGFLKTFGLRRLSDKKPYVSGRDFQITSVGKRFDSAQGLRDLETLITLGAAEIPDISIYNAYLPKKAGVAIGSGKATLTGNFKLSGVRGSAKLEMQARGVEVHVKEQTIKGDLRISTRLSDGNLEKMSFDASGTQLRIDNASLARR